MLEADAGAVGEQLDRLRILEGFLAHHEGDDVAAGAAAEAVKRLRIREDGEGRRLFAVERAKSGKPAAVRLQGDVA